MSIVEIAERERADCAKLREQAAWLRRVRAEKISVRIDEIHSCSSMTIEEQIESVNRLLVELQQTAFEEGRLIGQLGAPRLP